MPYRIMSVQFMIPVNPKNLSSLQRKQQLAWRSRKGSNPLTHLKDGMHGKKAKTILISDHCSCRSSIDKNILQLYSINYSSNQVRVLVNQYFVLAQLGFSHGIHVQVRHSPPPGLRNLLLPNIMRFLLVAIICFINSLRLVKRKKKKRKEKNRKERKVVLIIRMASELSLAELRDVQVQLSQVQYPVLIALGKAELEHILTQLNCGGFWSLRTWSLSITNLT